MPALSVKKRSQRVANHAWRAFLACRLGLGLFARPHNETVIRIGSYLFFRWYLLKKSPVYGNYKKSPAYSGA